MITSSYSQSGQDRFVDAVLEGKRDGIFLDIGANHPIELSNTYALERELGWTGTLVERDDFCVGLLKKLRNPKSRVIQEDATAVEYWKLDHLRGLSVIDYLSLDCDENTLPILKVLLSQFNGTKRFRVLTVETDLYRFGPGPRDAINKLLADYGYDILCNNVRASGGEIYETWAVDPKLVNMEGAEKFRSDGLKWGDILAKE